LGHLNGVCKVINSVAWMEMSWLYWGVSLRVGLLRAPPHYGLLGPPPDSYREAGPVGAKPYTSLTHEQPTAGTGDFPLEHGTWNTQTAV